jgi:putative SOS response-associated peptidase YedK
VLSAGQADERVYATRVRSGAPVTSQENPSMCGRFGLTNPELLEPRYNIAPSQPVLAARTWQRDRGTAEERVERRLDVLRWGLIPSWAKGPKIGTTLANARAETVAEKPSFRGAWKGARRALVFAHAFYEWYDRQDALTRRTPQGPEGALGAARGSRPHTTSFSAARRSGTRAA